MLVYYLTLLLAALNAAIALDNQSSSSLQKTKRGIVETRPNIPETYKSHQPKTHLNARAIQNYNSKLSPYHRDLKTSPIGPTLNFEDAFKQQSPYVTLPSSVRYSDPQSNEQTSPYLGNLFTMSAGYKVANDASPSKQIFLENQASHGLNSAIGSHGVPSSSNLQVPVFKTSYPLPKLSGPQAFAYGDIITGKKASLPILQAQKNEQVPSYLPYFVHQPLVQNSAGHQLNYPARTPKVNNVQLSAPFLSPLSSFQGQVVPISTAANNPQFPQYKGASIEVYPTAGGFSAAGYEPLQTQPQLHFGPNNVQPVDNGRHFPQAQEIRSDVEIINKKKPTTPPPKKDDDDDDDKEDDEGYTSVEKEYGPNSHDDDDYEAKPKPGKYFKAPATQGDFKPSTTFPFKQYDAKFGKHSSQYREEDAEEKPYSKYRHYSSSSDDDEEDSPAKYQAEDSSSKGYYNRHEEDDEEEEDGDKGYARQKTEEKYDTYKPKYFDKGFDEDYEASYRKESPKQSYANSKNVPEYGSRSSHRNKGSSYDADDSSSQGSRTSFNYHKTPRTFKDSEGESSDILTRTLSEAHEGAFGYKIPERMKNVKRS